MARTWILASVAVAIWVGAFGWYFVGTARIGQFCDDMLRSVGLRR